MQKLGRKIAEKVIDWAVPVICAGALLLWDDVPLEVRHYWPVLGVLVVGFLSLTVAIQNRNEIKRLRQSHESNVAKEAERKKVDENIAKAFRAMLDDDMGNLYGACVSKGYTTEDERRRYNRLHAAYEGVGGNGEAKRRKTHFDGILDEEEWKVKHLHNKNREG